VSEIVHYFRRPFFVLFFGKTGTGSCQTGTGTSQRPESICPCVYHHDGVIDIDAIDNLCADGADDDADAGFDAAVTFIGPFTT
jgi:hypothetical protein